MNLDNTTNRQFSIPVFPHVKKFIKKKYGIRSEIRTEETTSLGKYVTLALSDNRAWRNGKFQNKYAKLSESITLVLTEDQLTFEPQISKLLRINIDMDREFKSHLVSWIQSGRESGVNPMSSCRMFLAFYKIDEHEYGLGAAYKYWQRSKDSIVLNIGD